jgi:hypothetical protein
MAAPLVPFFMRFASGLRRPYLFALAAGLFAFDLLVPVFIPFIDEILLALATLILGSMKKKPEPKTPVDPPAP